MQDNIASRLVQHVSSTTRLQKMFTRNFLRQIYCFTSNQPSFINMDTLANYLIKSRCNMELRSIHGLFHKKVCFLERTTFNDINDLVKHCTVNIPSKNIEHCIIELVNKHTKIRRISTWVLLGALDG